MLYSCSCGLLFLGNKSIWGCVAISLTTPPYPLPNSIDLNKKKRLLLGDALSDKCIFLSFFLKSEKVHS